MRFKQGDGTEILAATKLTGAYQPSPNLSQCVEFYISYKEAKLDFLTL
jgi:hypothetical protein